MKEILQTVLFALLSAGLVVAQASMPKHWEFFSSNASHFEAKPESEDAHQGRSAVQVVSREASESDHALIYQKISAKNYRGKKLEVSGFLKASGVTGWAGLWVRVDDSEGRVLEFDNMMDRPVRGTLPWKSYEIKLDVPSQAWEIHFGALLCGQGEILVDDFKVEAVGRLLPGRELKKRIREIPEAPMNLGFEE